MGIVFNPVKLTEKIQEEYFSFFKSSFAPNNHTLMKKFDNLREREYLWKNPYISIIQQFKKGGSFEEFIKANNLSPLLKEAFNIKELYLHQRAAIKNILNGNNTIVVSGTGSGKTEVFLIPIIDYCIKNPELDGVKAIIVYPMNALANDQVERLRKILYKINQKLEKEITFAIYTGDTRDKLEDLENLKGNPEACPLTKEGRRRLGCPECDGKQLYLEITGNKSFLICKRNPKVVVDYQILTRKEIRDNPPDILITNYVQLEYLLLRRADSSLFSSGNVRFIVFDEIHTYSGARGTDVALLLRRLRRRLNNSSEIIHIGTSATISTEEEPEKRKEEIAKFAERLFGCPVNPSDVFEGYVEEWRFEEPFTISSLEKLEYGDFSDDAIFLRLSKQICPQVNEDKLAKVEKNKRGLVLGELLLRNPFFQELLKSLKEPKNIEELIDELLENKKVKELMKEFIHNREKLKEIIWSFLKVASSVAHPYLSTDEEIVPLLRVNIHNFFKAPEEIYICNKDANHVFTSPRDNCDICGASVDKLGVCRFCGTEFIISNVSRKDIENLLKEPRKSKVLSTIDEECEDIRIKKLSYTSENQDTLPLWQTYTPTTGRVMKKCIRCGSLNLQKDETCFNCGANDLREIYLVIDKKIRNDRETQPLYCPFCGHRYGPHSSALSPIVMSSNTASSTLFDLVYVSLPPTTQKLLIFTDNRQAAAYLAGYMEDEHLTHTIRALLYQIVVEEFDGYATYRELKDEAISRIREWYGGDFEEYNLSEWEIERKIDLELTSKIYRQRSLENLGLIEISYRSLDDLNRFKMKLEKYNENIPLNFRSDEDIEKFRKYLISIMHILRNDGAFKGLERNGEREVVGYIPSYKKEEIKKGKATVILLKGFFAKGRLFEFTKKVYNTNDKETIEILKFAFNFLERNNLIIKRTLQKWRRKAEGYLVNSSEVIVRIPRHIWKCDKCTGIYTNLPGEVCLTWRCQGKPKKIEYSEFEKNNTNYYFWLYKRTRPVRMVVQEDTGALDLTERRKIETEFKAKSSKERKVDVIVATPTLELGVDIGDLSSVGLFKAPPSPASYLQRVGRAGRKEGIALNNTFLFLSPVDMYYFRKPYELIKGEVRPPVINPENKHLLGRHINAIILEDLLVFSPHAANYTSLLIDKFIKHNYHDKIIEDLKTREAVILRKIKHAFSDLPISDREIKEYIHKFIEDFKKSIEFFKAEVERYNKHKEFLEKQFNSCQNRREAERIYKQLVNIQRHLIKLTKERDLLKHLMETGVLPRYAFPGVFVNIEGEFGEEYGGRSRNIAITEYCPGTEVYLKKHIYKVVGIDLRFTKPTPKMFYVCRGCKKYIKEEPFDFCPLCKRKVQTEAYYCIAPELILLRKTNKSIQEAREYQEALSDVFLSDEPKDSKLIDNFLLSDYGNVNITQIVYGIIKEDEEEPIPIELCSSCGKFKEKLSEKEHRVLCERNKWHSEKFERVNLFHTMPTKVVSIKLIKDEVFGIPIPRDKKYEFLITLKNAIINATQIITGAEDGEIEGVVKDDELILFDNVEGGVGYVEEVYKNFIGVLKQAVDMVLREKDYFGEECEKGCLKCLWSYRRKRDIRYIDKTLIVPLLQAVDMRWGKEEIFKENKKLGYVSKTIHTIHSPPLKLDGAIKLKDILRSAQEEIKITSLYITDDKIKWPDEGWKSWVDILTSIKQGPKNVKITVIIREPRIKAHKKAIRRLIESGINVKVLKKGWKKVSLNCSLKTNCCRS